MDERQRRKENYDFFFVCCDRLRQEEIQLHENIHTHTRALN
jgi:hypothetical protein